MTEKFGGNYISKTIRQIHPTHEAFNSGKFYNEEEFLKLEREFSEEYSNKIEKAEILFKKI